MALKTALEMYETMVANRGKARKLLERMQLLQPAVNELAELLDAGKLGDPKKREGALAVLTRVQGNFERARELIEQWAQHGAGFFGALKQARAGRQPPAAAPALAQTAWKPLLRLPANSRAASHRRRR